LIPRPRHGEQAIRYSDNGVPWYLQAVQLEGLDTLGEYTPWWRQNFATQEEIEALRTLKVEELKKLLAARNLAVTGKKAELLDRLQEAMRRYTMTDDGLVAAPVTASGPDTELPVCFPAVYEDVYLNHGKSGDNTVMA
jgi:hypothetical protein